MEISYTNSIIDINKNLIFDKGNIVSNTKNRVIIRENDKDIWSDDGEDDNDTKLLDNFISLFNINTYLFYEEPVKKINKKLGTITFIYLNRKYKANYSIEYPKIVYKDELFDNLQDWVKYIKKNKQKNIFISNFFKL
jgi:hypothetical protein